MMVVRGAPSTQLGHIVDCQDAELGLGFAWSPRMFWRYRFPAWRMRLGCVCCSIWFVDSSGCWRGSDIGGTFLHIWFYLCRFFACNSLKRGFLEPRFKQINDVRNFPHGLQALRISPQELDIWEGNLRNISCLRFLPSGTISISGRISFFSLSSGFITRYT